MIISQQNYRITEKLHTNCPSETHTYTPFQEAQKPLITLEITFADTSE